MILCGLDNGLLEFHLIHWNTDEHVASLLGLVELSNFFDDLRADPNGTSMYLQHTQWSITTQICNVQTRFSLQKTK